MTEPAIDLLLRRRSVVAKMMTEPGPDADALAQILTAAVRVPDHKMLVPWRLIVFEGEAREAFGRILAGVACLENEDKAFAGDAFAGEKVRFSRAPIVIAVVSTMKDTKPVPHWEQILSAGAVCQNVLVAASALGFAAQWTTEWMAYSQPLRPVLGLVEGERIAGFVYVGSAKEQPKERRRPDLAEIVSYWQAPGEA